MRVIGVRAGEPLECCLLGEPELLLFHWVHNGSQLCVGTGCRQCPGRRLAKGYPPAALGGSSGGTAAPQASDRQRQLFRLAHGFFSRNQPVPEELQAEMDRLARQETAAQTEGSTALGELVIPELTEMALRSLDEHEHTEVRGLWIRLVRAGKSNNNRLICKVLDRPPLRPLPQAFDVRPSVMRLWRLSAWPLGTVADADPNILSFEQRRKQA